MKDNLSEITFSDTENLSLFIEVGFSDFSAVVFDKLKKEFIYAESISFTQLSQLKEKSKLLNLQFDDIRALIFTPDFTIVPDVLSDSGTIDKYLKLTCGDKNEEIRTSHLSLVKATIPYYFKKELSEFLLKIYPNVQINHSVVGLSNAAKRDDDFINIHLYNNHFIALKFINNELSFVNSFEYNHFNDLLYSLLFIAKELQLKNTEIIISLSGHYNTNHIPLIEKYFKKVIPSPSSISEEQASRFVLLETLI